ncbi:MAG: S1 RNA-binding domain-containing protein, partial [Leptospiraceae bacterium]|nr:S1 RNA-binding domain-containing protein [Leptospiraceae bacterium]
MEDKRKQYFEKLLDESFKKRKAIEPGAPYTAKVSSIKDEYIFINIEGENLAGIVSSLEFIHDSKRPELGDSLNVFFLRESHGDYYFTSCIAEEEVNWDLLELAAENEIPVWAQFKAEINGGFEVKIGEFTGFCPHSQVSQELKGAELLSSYHKFIVNEIQKKNNRLIFSQKRISDRAKELKREMLREELEVGHFVSCRVKSIHKFGLIVDMNGLDALVPTSEASFKPKVDLEKEFQVGQNLRGKILSLDWETNKISLSIKDSLKDPWASSVPFKEGDIVKARVESIKPFGIFIRLNENFHALVPNKESGFDSRTPLAAHFNKGDEL